MINEGGSGWRVLLVAVKAVAQCVVLAVMTVEVPLMIIGTAAAQVVFQPKRFHRSTDQSGYLHETRNRESV